MKKLVNSTEEMIDFGQKIGKTIKCGIFIELTSDVGGGKTTFLKGLAKGLGIDEVIQSPTFTISRVYDAPNGLKFYHYDFYRLNDAGLMKNELAEVLAGDKNIVAVEWSDGVADILPADRLKIDIIATAKNQRQVKISALGGTMKVLEQIK